MKEFRVLQHIISCQQSQALNIKSQCWHFFSQTWQSAHPQISYKKKEPWGCYWLCTTKKLWYNHNSSLQNKLFRWLQTFNVTTASNARQWKVADEWSGDDLIIEVAPFQSDVCDDTGHYEICSAPWGYIDDLPLHIMNRLDDLERYFFFPEKFIYLCEKYILWKHFNFLINLKNWGF